MKVVNEEKREKELARLLKLQSKPINLSYLIFMMVILVIIYLIDEFTSNVVSGVRTAMIMDLFKVSELDEITNASSKLTLYTLPGYLMLIVAPFYKSLADKFGRKLFLSINVIGMALSMLIIMVSKNILTLVIGICMIQLFVPNDMQVMYIMETAPKKHRAFLSTIAKALGLLAVVLLSLLRLYYTDGETLLWRRVFLIPGIVGMSIGVLSYFLVRETPVYVDKRINLLRGEEVKEESDKKEGVKTFDAFKNLFKNPQLRWLMIAGFIFAASTNVTSNYEVIMTTGGAMTTDEISKVIFVFPFFNSLITFFSGFFMDKMGRKNSSILLGSLATISLFFFVFSSKNGWNPVLVGMFYGVFIGGLWSVSDMLFIIMPSESVRTDLRASTLGALSFVFSVGCGVSMIIFMVAGFVIDYLGWFSIFSCVPILAFAIFILIFKVKETNGVDLDEVDG